MRMGKNVKWERKKSNKIYDKSCSECVDTENSSQMNSQMKRSGCILTLVIHMPWAVGNLTRTAIFQLGFHVVFFFSSKNIFLI